MLRMRRRHSTLASREFTSSDANSLKSGPKIPERSASLRRVGSPTGREAAMFLLALAGPESDWIFGQVFPYAGGWVT